MDELQAIEQNIEQELQVIEKYVGGFSWLTALSTTALLIVSITVIVVVLAKTGVIGKLIDREIKSRDISTGAHRSWLEKIETSVKKIIDSVEDLAKRMGAIETVSSGRTKREERTARTIQEINNRITGLEDKFTDFSRQSYKRAVYNTDLPLPVRMLNGLKYLKLEGNSDTELFLTDELAKQDPVTWNVLCKEMDMRGYLIKERRKTA